jgi:hypothetical protein
LIEHIPLTRSGFGTLRGFEILFAKALRTSVLQESEEELLEKIMICSSIGVGKPHKKNKVEKLNPKKKIRTHTGRRNWINRNIVE